MTCPYREKNWKCKILEMECIMNPFLVHKDYVNCYTFQEQLQLEEEGY